MVLEKQWWMVVISHFIYVAFYNDTIIENRLAVARGCSGGGEEEGGQYERSLCLVPWLQLVVIWSYRWQCHMERHTHTLGSVCKTHKIYIVSTDWINVSNQVIILQVSIPSKKLEIRSVSFFRFWNIYIILTCWVFLIWKSEVWNLKRFNEHFLWTSCWC